MFDLSIVEQFVDSVEKSTIIIKKLLLLLLFIIMSISNRL